MSFFARLKQRKLVQWALAYAAGAWVVLQGLSLLATTYSWSPMVMRMAVGVAVVGFFVALVLAWYHGERGEQKVSGTELLIVTLLLSIGGGLLWWTTRSSPAAPAARAVVSAPAAPERSIAVLPFVNMSGDPKNEYFSDGLAETTLDMLAQVPDLKVIARTSSFAFKGKAQDMRQIGAALGAAHLLEGSVQQAGDTLRITVQLIKAADGTHLWSQHYDRPMVDLFKIQDEIASHVVQELAIALPAQQQQHLTQKRTENVAAYQEYLKGIALLPGRKVAEMRVAAEHFERAIALDPNYARAYAAASNAYSLLDNYGSISAGERAKISTYSDRALSLAPDLGEAHISRATVLEQQGDLPGAEREFRRGMELAPSFASGFQWYAGFLETYFGRVEEAWPLLERAEALDPLSPIVRVSLIDALIGAGRFSEAESQLAKLRADHPDLAQGFLAEMNLAATQGDLVRVLRAAREYDERNPGAANSNRCFHMRRFGAPDAAQRCLDALAARAPDNPTVLVVEAMFKAFSGDWVGADASLGRMPMNLLYLKAYIWTALGRSSEVLASYRQATPELLVDPPGKLYPGQVQDAVYVGIALLRTGAQAQGRALLHQALLAQASRPHAHAVDGAQWSDVAIHVALDEKELAFAALKEDVAKGYFLDLMLLDGNPLFADLRKDPRYEQILAPARAKAAAQVEAARKAGLL